MNTTFNDGVIDLSQFRKKKEEEAIEPFFSEATIITLGNEDESQVIKYILLMNLVIDGKQIIAIESTVVDEEGEVAIVEAIIEDGVFTGIEAIASEESYKEYVEIVLNELQKHEQILEAEYDDDSTTT